MKHQKESTFYFSPRGIVYNPETKKFLILEWRKKDAEFCKKYGPYDLPGGRMKEGETTEQALFRELQEEVGDVVLKSKGVVDCAVTPMRYSSGVQGVMSFYFLEYEGGEVALSDEHDAFAWKTAQEIEESKEYAEWLKTPIKKAVQKITTESYLDDLKRLQADFENYKKRVKNDERELYGHLSAQIVTDLIPVLDNLHAAIGHVPADAVGSPWVTGITYIEKQFEDVLANYGVEPMAVKPGDAFDPTRHEALDAERQNQEPGIRNQGVEKEIIAKVVQKGYAIKGKVIRPAKVIIKNHNS